MAKSVEKKKKFRKKYQNQLFVAAIQNYWESNKKSGKPGVDISFSLEIWEVVSQVAGMFIILPPLSSRFKFLNIAWHWITFLFSSNYRPYSCQMNSSAKKLTNKILISNKPSRLNFHKIIWTC